MNQQHIDRAMTAADVSSIQQEAIYGLASERDFGDIDILCKAVQERIALTAGDAFFASCAQRGADAAIRMRVAMLECAGELEHVRSMMSAELSHRGRLEHAFQGLQNELANTRVSERKALHRASHDGLTQLPNAELFSATLDRELAQRETRQQPLAVMFLDLDGFKHINDSHGHAVGDAVLRIVSARLGGAMRAGDVVSRIGGDEFACLLVGLPSRDQLSRLASQLLDSVASPMQVGSLMLSVRPSIGVALCPDDGVTPIGLLRSADAAMYRAKRQKCGYLFFDEPADGHADDIEPDRHSSVFDRLSLNGRGDRVHEQVASAG